MDIKELTKAVADYEELDMYALLDVLGDAYTVSYLTELEKDGRTYEAWIIHEKDEKGFTGKQIKDEKIYRDTAEKLIERFPNADVRVTSRQYKYAPEQAAEFMILLPNYLDELCSKLKIGDKIKLDNEPNNVYEIKDKLEDGILECAITNKDGYTRIVDIYPEDLKAGFSFVGENVNESVSVVSSVLNKLDEVWSDGELAQIGAVEDTGKKYKIYQNKGGEIFVTDKKLNDNYALMGDYDTFDNVFCEIEDNWEEYATYIYYDVSLLDDLRTWAQFEDATLDSPFIKDLSSDYADNEAKNESLEDDLKDHVNLAPEVDADKLANEIANKENEKPKMAQGHKKTWKNISGRLNVGKEEKKVKKHVEESLNEGYKNFQYEITDFKDMEIFANDYTVTVATISDCGGKSRKECNKLADEVLEEKGLINGPYFTAENYKKALANIAESINENAGFQWIVTEEPDVNLSDFDVALIGTNKVEDCTEVVAFCMKKDENPKERYFYELFTCYPDTDSECFESSIGDWNSIEEMSDAILEWNNTNNNEHVLLYDGFTPPSKDLIEKAENLFKGMNEDMATLTDKVDVAANDLEELLNKLKSNMDK